MQNTISSRSLLESPGCWKRRASQRGIMNQAPVANSEFFQNMVDVVLYRVLGKAQEFGDLLVAQLTQQQFQHFLLPDGEHLRDRKSTRLNSSHSQISYAVFCLKQKKTRI